MALIVILSGGSEIVSVSLAEEFLAADYSLAIVSLGKPSLLREVVDDGRYFQIDWPPLSPEAAAEELIDILSGLFRETARPVQVFPTEDGGLRLLLEFRERIECWAKFGFARALPVMGGLDKAELFEALEERGCSDIIAPTLILNELDGLEAAVERFRRDCVIKPALKPLSMDMEGMSSKVFESRGFNGVPQLRERLRRSWKISERWVVQQRLRTPATGEVVVWAVRDSTGGALLMSARGLRKHPRVGGTGCWVETADIPQQLAAVAHRVLDSVNFVGLCELEFLLDDDGDYRVLEINPRAWLQVGLAQAAGLPLAVLASRALSDEPLEQFNPARVGMRWVNVERLLLSAFSGAYGSRWQEIVLGIYAISQANVRVIYNTKLKFVRRYWLVRLVVNYFKAR